MLEFPPYFSFVDLIAFGFVIFGVAGSIYAILDWQSVIRGTKPDGETEGERSIRMVLMTLIAPIFFFVGLSVGIYDNWEAYHYRNLDLARITAANVRQIHDPFSAGRSGRLDDIAKLREGLALLRQCSAEVTLDHEHFEDGYSIALYVDGEDHPSYFITSYNRTSKLASKSGVEVAGQSAFSCRPFQEWVKANVEPIFHDTK